MPTNDTRLYYSLTPLVQRLPGVEHDAQFRHRQLVHLEGWLSEVIRQLLLGHAATAAAAVMLGHSGSRVGGRVGALDGEAVLEAHRGIHLGRRDK